jgi:hypothetical protein
MSVNLGKVYSDCTSQYACSRCIICDFVISLVLIIYYRHKCVVEDIIALYISHSMHQKLFFLYFVSIHISKNVSSKCCRYQRDLYFLFTNILYSDPFYLIDEA